MVLKLPMFGGMSMLTEIQKLDEDYLMFSGSVAVGHTCIWSVTMLYGCTGTLSGQHRCCRDIDNALMSQSREIAQVADTTPRVQECTLLYRQYN